MKKRDFETSATYDGDIMHFSSDEKRWINRIRKLMKTHPDSIRIIRDPEENDGCLYCTLPSSWFRIHPPPAKRECTEEEREAPRKRLKEARERKSNKEEEDS